MWIGCWPLVHITGSKSRPTVLLSLLVSFSLIFSLTHSLSLVLVVMMKSKELKTWRSILMLILCFSLSILSRCWAWSQHSSSGMCDPVTLVRVNHGLKNNGEPQIAAHLIQPSLGPTGVNILVNPTSFYRISLVLILQSGKICLSILNGPEDKGTWKPAISITQVVHVCVCGLCVLRYMVWFCAYIIWMKSDCVYFGVADFARSSELVRWAEQWRSCSMAGLRALQVSLLIYSGVSEFRIFDTCLKVHCWHWLCLQSRCKGQVCWGCEERGQEMACGLNSSKPSTDSRQSKCMHHSIRMSLQERVREKITETHMKEASTIHWNQQ